MPRLADVLKTPMLPQSEIDKIIQVKTPIYQFGQAATIKTPDFSFKKAIKKLGYQEVHSAIMGVDWSPNNEVSGVSDPTMGYFSINPWDAGWKETAMHEVGHLFLKHSGTIYDEMFNPKKMAKLELQALVFGYLGSHELGLDTDLRPATSYIRNYVEEGIRFTEKDFQKVYDKVKEFLEYGK